jgi:hypothetical protein
MYFSNIQSVAAILDSSDKKLLLVAKINNADVLHTVRVWLDIGSSCSLVSAWSVAKFGIPKTNLVKKILARGLGGVEVMNSKCNICLIVSNKTIYFEALVSHFSIMSRREHGVTSALGSSKTLSGVLELAKVKFCTMCKS